MAGFFFSLFFNLYIDLLVSHNHELLVLTIHTLSDGRTIYNCMKFNYL